MYDTLGAVLILLSFCSLLLLVLGYLADPSKEERILLDELMTIASYHLHGVPTTPTIETQEEIQELKQLLAIYHKWPFELCNKDYHRMCQLLNLKKYNQPVHLNPQ